MLEAAPLLLTKLALPPQRAHTLRRARVLALVPEPAEIRLLLVSAPAGFGKTTFLTSWCHELAQQRQAAVVWLALDERDNDVGRFVGYLAAGLARTLDLPSAEAGSGQRAELLLTQLVNTLVLVDRAVVLVLDDYQAITSPAVHAAVAFLLEYFPPHVCLAIGSRADPPLPIARLRTRDQLAELRAADLRFSADEIQAYFRLVNAAVLSAGEARAVAEYLEGWPAGVQLVALSLRSALAGHPAALPPDIPARLAGCEPSLFAYLADDVFAPLPSHIKTFLLETAVLERLCGGLCDAVLGLDLGEPALSHDSYSRLILETLAHDNLFIAPIDGEPRWYRYHPLFRAFLQELLGREPPGVVAGLHRRACDWYARSNLLPSAAEHALAAGDGEHAADLAERVSIGAMFPPRAHAIGTAEDHGVARSATHMVERLSERELEVLRLIAGGASNQRIADALVISLGTVKSHINHILGKLGASNRTAAVALARDCGLLAAPPCERF